MKIPVLTKKMLYNSVLNYSENKSYFIIQWDNITGHYGDESVKNFHLFRNKMEDKTSILSFRSYVL